MLNRSNFSKLMWYEAGLIIRVSLANRSPTTTNNKRKHQLKQMRQSYKMIYVCQSIHKPDLGAGFFHSP